MPSQPISSASRLASISSCSRSGLKTGTSMFTSAFYAFSSYRAARQPTAEGPSCVAVNKATRNERENRQTFLVHRFSLRLLRCFHHLLRDVLWHLRVVVERHREVRAALGQGA